MRLDELLGLKGKCAWGEEMPFLGLTASTAEKGVRIEHPEEKWAKYSGQIQGILRSGCERAGTRTPYLGACSSARLRYLAGQSGSSSPQCAPKIGTTSGRMTPRLMAALGWLEEFLGNRVTRLYTRPSQRTDVIIFSDASL